AGHVQMVAALEPGRVDVAGAQPGRGAPVGDERALAVRGDERDDDAAGAREPRAAELDSVAREPLGREPAGAVLREHADEAGAGTESSRPGGDVRRLAARPDGRLRRHVVA